MLLLFALFTLQVQAGFSAWLMYEKTGVRDKVDVLPPSNNTYTIYNNDNITIIVIVMIIITSNGDKTNGGRTVHVYYL